MSRRGETLSQAGYSLLELLIVLAILGAVAATLSGGIFSRDAETLEGLADKVRTLAATQKLHAVRHGTPANIVRDPEMRRLVGASGDVVMIPASVEAELVGTIPPHASEPALVFFPDGRVLGGTVNLSRGGERRVIAVTGELGHADATQ